MWVLKCGVAIESAHRDIVMTFLFTTWLRLHCIDRAPASPTSLTLPTIRAHQVGNAYTKLMTRVAPRDAFQFIKTKV